MERQDSTPEQKLSSVIGSRRLNLSRDDKLDISKDVINLGYGCKLNRRPDTIKTTLHTEPAREPTLIDLASMSTPEGFVIGARPAKLEYASEKDIDSLRLWLPLGSNSGELRIEHIASSYWGIYFDDGEIMNAISDDELSAILLGYANSINPAADYSGILSTDLAGNIQKSAVMNAFANISASTEHTHRYVMSEPQIIWSQSKAENDFSETSLILDVRSTPVKTSYRLLVTPPSFIAHQNRAYIIEVATNPQEGLISTDAIVVISSESQNLTSQLIKYEDDVVAIDRIRSYLTKVLNTISVQL